MLLVTDFHTLPRNVAMVAVFNTAIAAALWLGRGGSFAASLVYSQCIGISILLLIDVTRRLLWGEGRPGALPMTTLAAGGIATGFFVGTALASKFVEAPYAGRGILDRQTLASMAITLFSGTAVTYYFVNRERIAELRLRAEAVERAAAQAQLKLLQAQIEPHFLFNTLANLHSLIATDPSRAQRMLEHLNDYLRATLDGARRDWGTLDEEFARLRGYLEVIAVRMGPRLSFALSLPQDLASARIPPMLLQPLVENAVKHGLEPKIEGGRIDIAVRKEANALKIEIADTGLGLGNSSIAGTNVGLQHVRERLAAAYGDPARLELKANEKGGATAIVTLPTGDRA